MSAPAFVYVVPARYEDILKLGFSHDPCARVRSFHPRYFEYFDLERGFIINAMDEADARAIERTLATVLADHRSRAPLVISPAAGGYTEWYRGALEALRAAAQELVDCGGYAPLMVMRECLHKRLLQERELLFERSNALLDAIEALGNEPQAGILAQRLRNLLDAYAALEIDVEQALPADVRDWLERNR